MSNPGATDQDRALEAADPPPAAQQPAAAQPQRPSPKTASFAKSGEDDFALTLFILLFAGLVVGGLLYAVVRRRNRVRLEDDRPPIWTRIVSAKAPVARIRGRERDAWTQALGEQFTAPPLAPDDHSEQLARALQQLADRLRARPGAAPGIVPGDVRPRRARHDGEPVPPPRWLADSFAADEARRHSPDDSSMW
jgi:hypothetical protein